MNSHLPSNPLRNEVATLEAEAAGRDGALELEARWVGEQEALFGFRTDFRYHAYTTPPSERVDAEASVSRSGAAFVAGVRGEAFSPDGSRCDHFAARDAVKGAGARRSRAAAPAPSRESGGWSFLEHEAPRLGEKNGLLRENGDSTGHERLRR